jgi:hypothetical protein
MADRAMKVRSYEVDDKEAKALRWLYEHPGPGVNTYTLAMMLYPDVNPSSKDFAAPYDETRDVVEKLVMLKLVNGERGLDAARRIYRSDLKLSHAGERKAIELSLS